VSEPETTGKAAQDRYVALAEVAKPHGLAGELRLKVYNPSSDLILKRPASRFVLPDGRCQSACIRAARRVSNGILIQVEGITDRRGADGLRGARLEVSRAQLGEPAVDDEFYVCDLEGCSALVEGRSLGTVRHVVPYPSCDALVVTRPDGDDLEVPMHERFVAAVNISEGIIELRHIDELE